MMLFRIFLAGCFLAILAYTSVTIANHGWDLMSVFFGDMAKMGWPGQFNLDFMLMLAASGLWTAWRNRFSPAGLALGVVAFFGGMSFQSLHLLYLTTRPGADMQAVLLGANDPRA